MKNLDIMVSRHSAFYSPLIACIAGDFLNSEGIEATYNIVKDGGNSAMEVGNGNMDVAQAAVSASWGPLEKGENLSFTHFAQINRFDGFFILGRENDKNFSWEKLSKSKFLYVHGGQPEAMLRYAAYKENFDLDSVDNIFSAGGDQMMKQWDNGEGEYFHEQGAFPQQLELEGKGFLLTSVGKSIGPVAFSSLVCRNDWLQTDESIAFSKAYSASRKWVNTANPQEVAYIEKDFFPEMNVESISNAIDFYQKLGTWSGEIAIEKDLYETALDVFEFSNLISKRHSYDEVVSQPPNFHKS